MTDTKQAQQMINSALALYDAKIKAGQANPLNEIQPIKIDLTKGRSRDNAMKISFPFKSMRVAQATDLKTFIYLIPENADQGRGATRLGLLDAFNTEYGFASCYIYWDAQPKSVLLEFYTTSNISNGRLVLEAGTENPDQLSIGGISGSTASGLRTVMFRPSLGRASHDTNTVYGVEGDFPTKNAWSSLSTPDFAYGGDAVTVPLGMQAEILGWKAFLAASPVMSSVQINSLNLKVVSGPINGVITSIDANLVIPLLGYSVYNSAEGIVYKTNTRSCIIDEGRCFNLQNNQGAWSTSVDPIIHLLYRLRSKAV